MLLQLVRDTMTTDSNLNEDDAEPNEGEDQSFEEERDESVDFIAQDIEEGLANIEENVVQNQSSFLSLSIVGAVLVALILVSPGTNVDPLNENSIDDIPNTGDGGNSDLDEMTYSLDSMTLCQTSIQMQYLTSIGANVVFSVNEQGELEMSYQDTTILTTDADGVETEVVLSAAQIAENINDLGEKIDSCVEELDSNLAGEEPIDTGESGNGTNNETLCDVFNGIQSNNADLSTAEGWEMRINLTEQLVSVAPEDLQDEAAIYLQLVKDRADLVAEYGYVSVQELPADVRNDFISANYENQQESNELIDYAHSVCDNLDEGEDVGSGENDGSDENNEGYNSENNGTTNSNETTIASTIFAQADDDGDGLVSVDEMIQHMADKREADGEEPMSDQVIQMLTEKILSHDEDGDEAMNEDEFENFSNSFNA